MKKRVCIIIASVVGFLLVLNLTLAGINYQNPKPFTFLGLKMYYASTETMQPYIKQKAFVVVKSCSYDEIKVSDVIDYKTPDMEYTVPNRVRQITEDGLVTKGDAVSVVNNYFVTSDQLYGKVVFKTNLTANFVNEIGTVGGIFKWIILPAACIVLFFVLRNIIRKKIEESKRIYDEEDEGLEPQSIRPEMPVQDQNRNGVNYLQDNFVYPMNGSPMEEPYPEYSPEPVEEPEIYEQPYQSGYRDQTPDPYRPYQDDYETPAYNDGRSVRSRYEADRIRYDRNGMTSAFDEGRSVRSRYEADRSAYENVPRSRYETGIYRTEDGVSYQEFDGEASESRYKRRYQARQYDDRYEGSYEDEREGRYRRRMTEEDDLDGRGAYSGRDRDEYEEQRLDNNFVDEHEEEEGAHVKKPKNTKKSKSVSVEKPESEAEETKFEIPEEEPEETEEAKTENTSVTTKLVKVNDAIPDIDGVKKPEYSIVIDFVSPDKEEEAPSIRVRMLDGQKNTMAMTTFNGDPKLIDDISGRSEINMRLITPNNFDINGTYNTPLSPSESALIASGGSLPSDGLKGLRLAMGSIVFDLEYSAKDDGNTIGFDDYLYSYHQDVPELKD